MTTTEHDTPLETQGLHITDEIALEAGELPPMHHLGTTEVGQKDRTNMADWLANVGFNTRVHLLMEPAAAALWDAGGTINAQGDERYSTAHRMGLVLLLDALINAPRATMAMLQRVRNDLVNCDPALALMGEAPVPPELVTPRYHQINGSTFFIDRDGNLSIDEREGGRPLVKLTAQETYGLLTFMRLPGVAQLIEQVDAADQDRTWHDFESDEREEMTRKQALELLLEDKELLTLVIKHIAKDHVITPRDAA